MCPARELNPRSSAFRADALTTELRGWDDSTRRNFFTQLCLAFRVVLTLHVWGEPQPLQWQLRVWSRPTQLLGKDQTAGSFDLICKQMLEFPGKEDVELEKEGIPFKDQLYGRVRFWMMMVALKIPNFKTEAKVIFSKWGVKRLSQEDVDEM